MKARAIATLTAAAVLLALASPAGAAASTRHYRRPASVDSEVHLRGTAGFRFTLFVIDRRAVIVTASRRLSRTSDVSVDYFAGHDTASAEHSGGGDLNVRIGRLGRFRAHFTPTSTKTEAAHDGCKGEPTTVEKGFFVGAFDFRGERGYSSFHTERARGTVTRTGAARCAIDFPASQPGHESPRHAKAEREREEDEFRLVTGDDKGAPVFQANREAAPAEIGLAPTTFLVSVTGQVGDFQVSHSAFVLDFRRDSGATFQTPNLAEPLAEAVLQPPAPFSGSATFHLEAPKTASWTGDLAVELPGLPRVPLTGTGIDAGLCKGASHCTATLPPRLAAILRASGGSGYGVGSVVVSAPS